MASKGIMDLIVSPSMTIIKDLRKKLSTNSFVDQAYKSKWVWYHTILALELLIIIVIQIAILAKI